MTKITKSQRAQIVAYIASSASYDARTVRITKEGMVTALKDADKTFAGDDPRRYNIGFADDLLREIEA